MTAGLGDPYPLLRAWLRKRRRCDKMLAWTHILIGIVLLPSWMSIWFGLFVTWQGILLLVSAAGLVISSYYLAEHRAVRRRAKPREAGHMETSTQV